jgi:hypothetical protein
MTTLAALQMALDMSAYDSDPEYEATPSPATSPNKRTAEPEHEPAPRKMLLRQSSTLLAAAMDAMMDASPAHSPDSSQSSSQPGVGGIACASAELAEFRRRLADPVGPHLTSVECFRRDGPSGGADALGDEGEVVAIDQVINMEPVFALLREHVQKPMANPVLSRCESPVLCLEGPNGVGLRTAVRAYCAQADQQYRCNLITYRYFSPSELMQQTRFFAYLFALARTLTPCVVLIHRPLSRLADGARELLARISEAFIPYSEQRRGARLPPFWLVFADQVPPGRVLPNWSFIDKRCFVGSMTVAQRQDYLRRKIAARLEEILLEAQDIQYQMARYSASVSRVVAENQQMFAGVHDLNTYVACLFALPPQRASPDQLRSATHQIDADHDLPSVALGDFDHAVQGVVRTRESEKAKMEARQQEEAARSQAEMRHIMEQFH